MAEAVTYFDTRYDTSGDWSGSTDAQKTGSLLAAAQALEGLCYPGAITTDTQSLQFPRTGVHKRNGLTYEDSATIPQRIKDAQCEWAGAIVAGTYLLTPQPEVAGPVTVGPVTAAPDKYGAYRRIPPQVLVLLKGMIDEGSYLNFQIGR